MKENKNGENENGFAFYEKNKCLHPVKAKVASQQLKVCVDCGKEIEWPLKPGAKIINHNLPDRT